MDKVEAAARALIDAIFADIRDRKFIKWLFTESSTPLIDKAQNDWLTVTLRGIGKDAQEEIAEAWQNIAATALTAAEQRGRRAGMIAAAEIAQPYSDQACAGILDKIEDAP